MTSPCFHYEPALPSDLDELVALRIEAMRESLEHLGRFDPLRARERFASSFEPASTRFIVTGAQRVGFLVVKQRDDGLLLDHLYIHPSAQRRGLGSAVLCDVVADADRRKLPLHLGALRASASNRFYLRHGFVPTGEGEWDIYYCRHCRPART